MIPCHLSIPCHLNLVSFISSDVPISSVFINCMCGVEGIIYFNINSAIVQLSLVLLLNIFLIEFYWSMSFHVDVVNTCKFLQVPRGQNIHNYFLFVFGCVRPLLWHVSS